jgi:prepilin-type N-terminal cleavage/methylation domain-containing protein
MNDKRCRRVGTGSGGFTLLEVLISMTVLAMILGIIATVLRVGVRASGQARVYAGKGERERDTADLLVHQIRSARPGGAQAAFFEGSASELRYETTLSLLTGAVGRFRVHLAVEESEDGRSLRLLYREWPAGRLGESGGESEPEAQAEEEESAVVLLDGLSRCEFGYLAFGSPAPAGEPEWSDTWDPAEQGGRLPAAVRWMVESEAGAFSEDILVPVYCSGVLARAAGK